ncbi:MAG: phosphoenolpyruvate synthase [Kofleriaceae bacterium]|nr:phosphoenolpyruvate synthase [Kofleriaceae bacterium]MCL4227552.1 phosphoenolpyruvate synthase [Myxococcales bacterium]
MRWIRPLAELTIRDVALAGGKNASLGEMIRELAALGVRVPDGFAVTAPAYRHVLREAGLEHPIADLLAGVRKDDVDDLTARAARLRELVLGAPLPADLVAELDAAYRGLGDGVFVAVRSSATAEDLPGASFAGQQESFLQVRGLAQLQDTVRRCFASLFTARAISYRIDMGFAHEAVALSVGVQRMVRSDLASAGVIFTLDPESGNRDLVLVTSAWGLGENVVQGRVRPDELYVHAPTLRAGHRSLFWTRIGTKERRLVWDAAGSRLVDEPTPEAARRACSLSADDALVLARWAVTIEDHYSRVHGTPTPMDIEWAKDGLTGELFVVQARPETVHAGRGPIVRLYHLRGGGEIMGEGVAIGAAIGHGTTRTIADPRDIATFRGGEVLVTDTTDPDWEPVMKKASAIVTARGGRTSHAAIVARELGIPAVVGVPEAMARIPGGALVTVSCADGAVGRIYRGHVDHEIEELDVAAMPPVTTRIYMNLAQPEQAFRMAQLPSHGIGLARMEFVFAGWVGVHPLALTRYDRLPHELRLAVDERTAGYADRTEFFVDRLAQGIAVLAAAFWPRPVILRFSDFKTNEYARLLGGAGFEPREENPMLGWRGASRYYHPEFKDGFLLECAAVRRVRDEMGLTNLKLMVPFCRTPDEGARVLEVAAGAGLRRGERDLDWYVMAEIPSNVLLAERFAELFDGFSIGSNDLTQLVLGVDRDSERVAPLFDERDPAVERACVMLLEAAHRAGRTVGICGQAPSDYPEFAAFLVEHGIDSLSLTPDAVVPTWRRIAALEAGR